MTESLVDRIRAALDEDERIARATPANGIHWDIALSGNPPWSVEGDQAFVEHVVRHDPARVLRQVTAMRKILDFAAVMDEDRYPGADYVTALLADALGIEDTPNG